jgi:hypothetical protein
MKALSSALLQLMVTTLHNKPNNVFISSYGIHFKVKTCLQSLNALLHVTITDICYVLHACSHTQLNN